VSTTAFLLTLLACCYLSSYQKSLRGKASYDHGEGRFSGKKQDARVPSLYFREPRDAAAPVAHWEGGTMKASADSKSKGPSAGPLVCSAAEPAAPWLLVLDPSRPTPRRGGQESFRGLSALLCIRPRRPGWGFYFGDGTESASH